MVEVSEKEVIELSNELRKRLDKAREVYDFIYDVRMELGDKILKIINTISDKKTKIKLYNNSLSDINEYYIGRNKSQYRLTTEELFYSILNEIKDELGIGFVMPSYNMNFVANISGNIVYFGFRGIYGVEKILYKKRIGNIEYYEEIALRVVNLADAFTVEELEILKQKVDEFYRKWSEFLDNVYVYAVVKWKQDLI